MDFKSFREMLKKIFLSLFIAAAFACQANTNIDPKVEGSNNLEPEAQQEIVTKKIVELIENFHYKKVKLTDSISEVIFNNYLKRLDEGHTYLLASDVKDFEQYKYSLDDQLRDGDLNALFRIFNIFQKRYDERLKYSLSQVNTNFSFDGNEVYTYDRSKLPWFKSEAEANEAWLKRVKYDLLNLRITGSEEEKNVKTLKQRYENLLSQSNKTNNQDAFQIMMDAFTESIDPHTNYFVPTRAQEFNEEMARTFEGIGARLQLENEVVKIAEIIPGGPAYKAKTLNVDDKIIAVAQGKDGEFVDVIGWRLDNTVSKIKGPKGTMVRLKIIPAGQEISSKPKIVELYRDKVVLQDQSAKKTIKTVTSGGKTYKIGVIDVPGFYADFKAYQAGDPNYKSTTRDVRMILDTLKQQKVDGVMIDLRSNGGGSLMEAIELTGLFIKTGPVVQVRDARNQVEVDKDEDESIAWNGPLGVIVDRFSASASEIFAGAIQDYGRGIILGTQTYGKGTVQSALDMARFIGPADKLLLMTKKGEETASSTSKNLPKFGQINLTMAKFYRVNGNSTQHKGVIPDIKFPMVFPADKFGESSEPSALPFDVIKPSNYAPVADLSGLKTQLSSMHEKRMKAAPEYKYLLEDIEQFRKRSSETSVTLNEEKLKKERDEQEARTLARDNQRRALKGLPPLKKGEPKPKDDVDFIQNESLNVLVDFIQLGKSTQLTFKY
ncbi:carboxy terminal-processing peptidase [Rubrolithibacter danxiaensis]|uniref:carboxy terminal-processing peptidase n=1 Tax=Rubrolithibacter danxiaensis TaxID=3390805 RepID=UPI003BF7A7C6